MQLCFANLISLMSKLSRRASEPFIVFCSCVIGQPQPGRRRPGSACPLDYRFSTAVYDAPFII